MKYFLCIILLLTYLLFGLFISDDHRWIIFFMQIVTIILCYLIVKNNKNKYIFNLNLLLIPFLVLLVLGIFIEFPQGYIKALPYIIFMPLMALLIIKWVINKSIIAAILMLILVPINSFILFPNWFVFNQEMLTSSELIGKEFPILDFYNNNNELKKIPENKVIVLDFWTTNCKICFEKFPEYDKIKKQYVNNNPDIEFYSVNVALARDSFEKTKTLVDSLNYSFETIYLKNEKEVQTKLKFNTYPKIVILKNNKVEYFGGMNTGKILFVSNLEREINDLLN